MTLNEYAVAGLKPPMVVLVTFADTICTNPKGPPGLVAWYISKLDSLSDLSVQNKLTDVLLAAEPLRALGAAGTLVGAQIGAVCVNQQMSQAFDDDCAGLIGADLLAGALHQLVTRCEHRESGYVENI